MAKRSLFELSRALKFFADGGFLSISERASPSHYQYGANGGLFLHNFLSEWFIENVAVKERVSMVSTSIFSQTSQDETGVGRRLNQSLHFGGRQFYDELLNLNEGRLPFGIASTARCVDSSESRLPVLGMLRPEEFTECLVEHFVSEKLVTDTLHRLEVDHLMWWKKLTSSKRISSRRLANVDGGTSGHIVYSSPHGDTTVESLDVSGPHTELANSPFIIASRTSADVAALVLLHDAYTETGTDDDGQRTQRLTFHHRLAPYKLGILFEGRGVAELGVVADHIKDELRKETILIQTNHNGSDHRRLQSSGVPYSVTLSDVTLVDGTVLLEDLSSSTKEMVHVTNLKEKILKYIKSE